MVSTAKRNDVWLLSRLDELWSKYFSDIIQDNQVFIKFGRFSKYRLGSIKQVRKASASYITITAMFRNLKIPQAVIDHTIAHELVHYAHGFSSTKTRLHKYPHAGGVVKKEMESRNMGHLNKAYRAWIKNYRETLLRSR